MRSLLVVSALIAPAIGCAVEDPSTNSEPAEARIALERFEVMQRAGDGLPAVVAGDVGRVADVESEQQVRVAIAPYLSAYRIRESDLVLQRVVREANGDRLYRFAQREDGVDVIGGMVIAHVDARGGIRALTSTARGPDEGLGLPAIDAAAIVGMTSEPVEAATRFVYYISEDRRRHAAYELRSSDGWRGDRIGYYDANTGALLGRNDALRSANREAYLYIAGSPLPGAQQWAESGPIGGADPHVGNAFVGAGTTRDMYLNFFGRDGIDGSGGEIVTTSLADFTVVHAPDTHSCNGWWNGNQIVLGLGGGDCAHPADEALDVIPHEYTHGVTADEGDLNNSGEANGLDESISDIFGAAVEAWRDAGSSATTLRPSWETWLNGEDMFTSTAYNFRNLCNPKLRHLDYQDYYSATLGTIAPHRQATVTDLMFCLLAKGGPHPRPTPITTPQNEPVVYHLPVNVPAIGIDRAIHILYSARNALSQTATVADLRAQMELAAAAQYTVNEQIAVSCAFAAVGVGSEPTAGSCNRTDILFANHSTGAISAWLTGASGQSVYASYSFGTASAGYQPAGIGDFDNDGKSDILLKDVNTGQTDLWLTRGSLAPTVIHSTSPGKTWTFQTVGDFDGGGVADILWRNASNVLKIWQMNAGARTEYTLPGTLPNWTIKGTADFNRDGRSDVVMSRTNASGNVEVGLLHAQASTTVALSNTPVVLTPTPMSATWVSLIGAGDFNDDGVPDLVFRNFMTGAIRISFVQSTGGTTYSIYSEPLVTSGGSVVSVLAGTDFVGIGDLDGDRKSDIAWQGTNTNNQVFVWRMNAETITSSATLAPTPPGDGEALANFN